MTKLSTTKIPVSECRYCDHTMSHRPYGMDDVAVCVGCGAEWDPVTVYYTEEELYGPSTQEEEYVCTGCGVDLHNNPQWTGTTDMCQPCFDKEYTVCPSCDTWLNNASDVEDIRAVKEEGKCIDCINYDYPCEISGHKQGVCPCDQCCPEAYEG